MKSHEDIPCRPEYQTDMEDWTHRDMYLSCMYVGSWFGNVIRKNPVQLTSESLPARITPLRRLRMSWLLANSSRRSLLLLARAAHRLSLVGNRSWKCAHVKETAQAFSSAMPKLSAKESTCKIGLKRNSLTQKVTYCVKIANVSTGKWCEHSEG